jgi:hypothetical protein
MSAEMCKIAANRISNDATLRDRVVTVGVQIDFSNSNHLDQLRRLVLNYCEEAPIIYSLLGNTIGNFLYDTDRLHHLLAILRHQDRFLLEVAVTEKATEEALREAEREYGSSAGFRKFVASSILSHTDLPTDELPKRIQIIPEIEELNPAQAKSLLLKVVYRNISGSTSFRVTSSIDDLVEFREGDTIRVYVTRKYTEEGVAHMMKQSEVINLGQKVDYYNMNPPARGARFGMLLSVCGLRSDEST